MFERNRSLKQVLRQGRVFLVMFLCFSLVFTTFTPAFAASDVEAKTKMKHSPPKYFVPEHRIQLDAKVSDPNGIELVRCYFKAAGEEDFVFVPMAGTGKNNYSGVLPAPSPTTEQIEYLFLSVNTENVIVKSQTFILDKKEKDKVPAWQEIPAEGEIQVSMELDNVPSELTGFNDNIVMDSVESGLRFGIVAGGLYTLTASTSGSAASAATAGTISAGAAGMSTAGIIGVGVLGAAAAGGAAAAAGGGGSSGGSSSEPLNPSNPSNPDDQITESAFVGNWRFTVNLDGANLGGYYGDCTFNADGTGYWSEYYEGKLKDSGNATWSYDKERRYFFAQGASNSFVSGTVTFSATANNSFAIKGEWYGKPATYNFSRR